MYENNISAYTVLAGNSEVGELGRPKRRLECNTLKIILEKKNEERGLD
jgi:hypothetical protein